MKAMLLAAGRGSRLKPLTDKLPKPLVVAGEFSLIEHAILKLKKAGICDIVINLAYLADKIVKQLGNGAQYGVTLEYSYEGTESLGTGGGVYRALDLLGAEPFWLLSGDIYSSFSSFNQVLRPNTVAHLVMVPNPDFHPEGDYGLQENGALVRSAPKLTYGNIALIDPKLFAGCQPGVFSLSPVFNKAVLQNTITGELFQGNWFNVGTLVELEKLRQHLGRPSAGASAS